MDHASRIPDDDLAALIDMSAIPAADYTDQDIDDAILAAETYLPQRR